MPLPPATSIISILTNFFLYWTFHPSYRQEVYDAVGNLTTAFT